MESFPFVKLENDGTIFQLFACRVCLETDSKLYDLHKYKLADIFGELTGTQVSRTDGLPQHICSICYVQLRKSSAFRAKCRQVHVLLQDARVRQPLMTTSYVKSLDRTHLKYKLTLTNALNLTYPSETEITLEVTHESAIEAPSYPYEQNPLIKAEPLEFIVDEISDDWNNDSEFMECQKISPINVKKIIKKDNEQTEDFVENTEDDEEQKVEKTFVEVFATTTEQKKPEKPETRSKTKKKVTPKRKLEVPKPEKMVPEKKRKRPCNMKFVEDFAGFNEAFNCEVLFLTKEQQMKEVQERKDSNVFKKSRFKCNVCYKGFMNVSAHKKHMTTHDKISGDNMCEVCFARFKVRHRLLCHIRLHKFRFVCKTCDHVSKDSSLAKAHFRWHQGFKYECKECKKEFNTLSTHLNHKRQLHASLTCELCNAKVSGTKGLEEHIEKVHSAAKFPCNRCKKQFESQEAFDRHFNSNGVCFPRNCPCTKCGETFQNKPQLYDHRETVHNETWYRCDECPEAYTTGRMLASHWTFRHAKSSFMCEICARSYKSASALRTHQRVHAGKSHSAEDGDDDPQGKADSAEPTFQCPMCPKQFRAKANMKIHINTHTGERPFQCTLCDETFKSHSQKYKHNLMVHKKERRYKCDMCEKAYVVSSDLKMHIRTFHMKIPRPPPNRRKNRNSQIKQLSICKHIRTFHMKIPRPPPNRRKNRDSQVI